MTKDIYLLVTRIKGERVKKTGRIESDQEAISRLSNEWLALKRRMKGLLHVSVKHEENNAAYEARVRLIVTSDFDPIQIFWKSGNEKWAFRRNEITASTLWFFDLPRTTSVQRALNREKL